MISPLVLYKKYVGDEEFRVYFADKSTHTHFPLGICQALPSTCALSHVIPYEMVLIFTTLDFARIGQLILQNDTRDGRQVVPADWFSDSTWPSAPTDAGKIGYGYQWWILVDAHEDEFMARRVYGQYVYFDQPRGVLIVTTGTDRKFR